MTEAKTNERIDVSVEKQALERAPFFLLGSSSSP